MNNIYEISKLKCKYPSNTHPVLEIESLNIEHGSRTFFIGASGVGKSTILETLGLMNNTIYKNGDSPKFNFHYEDCKEDIIELWKQKEKNIAKFRRKHLSFIFQNTNLFKTLSSFENISISAILQGKSRTEAVNQTKDIVRKILPNVTQDKPIMELSGGQRQRVAFARAIVNDYSVLFADEPTGNLDIANAHNLMNILMENIHNQTTIIVTHDIDMAVKYATKIVFINKEEVIENNEGKYAIGKISSPFIFNKNVDDSWSSSDKDFQNPDDFVDFLKSQINKQAG